MPVMKQSIVTLFTLALLFFPAADSPAQGDARPASGDTLLAEISGNIDAYKSRTLTLRLRLKHVDKIFEKITFYDAKNHDIEFDYSPRALKKKLAADFLNIHEGMYYSVTFVVQNVGNLGEIIAELKGFKPVVLETVPEKGSDR